MKCFRERCKGLKLTWKELTPLEKNSVYDFKVDHEVWSEWVKCKKFWDTNRAKIVLEVMTWDVTITMVYANNATNTGRFSFTCGIRAADNNPMKDATEKFMIMSRMENENFIRAEFVALVSGI